MVDLVKKDSIAKIQVKYTKFIKKWLNLPRYCAQASMFHPAVLKLPFLPYCQESAKMSMIIAVDYVLESIVKECLAMLMDPGFVSRNQFPQETPHALLTAARESISQVTNSSKSSSAKSILSKSLQQKHNDYWNASLDHLQEPTPRSWNRLITGLPAGQLSFLTLVASPSHWTCTDGDIESVAPTPFVIPPTLPQHTFWMAARKH